MLESVPALCLPKGRAQYVIDLAMRSERTEAARAGVLAPRSRRKPLQPYEQAHRSWRAREEARLLRRVQRIDGLYDRLQREEAARLQRLQREETRRQQRLQREEERLQWEEARLQQVAPQVQQAAQQVQQAQQAQQAQQVQLAQLAQLGQLAQQAPQVAQRPQQRVWTATETELLRKGVAEHTDTSTGRISWANIVPGLPGRGIEQAKQRWKTLRKRVRESAKQGGGSRR